ncbi:hypothetical protein J6590_032198 [Homalodisca vitripennis]|nr:hypothetical protein J6590_032198 [Homalodisca vitripennis]
MDLLCNEVIALSVNSKRVKGQDLTWQSRCLCVEATYPPRLDWVSTDGPAIDDSS